MPYVDCQICSNSFYAKPSHLNLGWSKYCSVACRTQAQFLGKQISCSVCHKEIYRSPRQIRHSKSGNFFCGKTCQTKWKNSLRLAEKHPNWKNGQHSYRKRLMRTTEKQVCVVCGIKDIRILVAHHIDHNRENNVPSNLTWVCLNCHHLIHHDQDFENALKMKVQTK
jgi:hypothetical protein